MPSAIDVPESLIGSLNDTGLQSLLCALLRYEADLAGLFADDLEFSSNVHAPDGGIDALLDTGKLAGHRFLPTGVSVWQSRSGKAPLTTVREEFEKPLVREKLRHGGTYVLVLNRSLNSKERKDLIGEEPTLLQALRKQSPLADLRVFSAQQMAEWTTMHPAAWRLVGHSLGGFEIAARWLAQEPQHDPTYQPTPSREAIRARLREWERDDRGDVHVRLHGKPGVGKSRLALESFRESGPSVLYVQAPEDVEPGFLEGLRDRPGITAVLIIDKCEADQAERLASRIRTQDRRIRMLSVGPDRANDPSNQFQVDELPREAVLAVVREVALLPPLAADWVARHSGGSVKLARELAHSVALSGPGADLSDLNLRQHVGKMIPQEARAPMTALALLTRVGWQGDVAHEYDSLCDLLGVDSDECRRAIPEMESQGYVGRMGRFRYVTPEILAIYLVAQEWEARPAAMQKIWKRLPAELMDRFVERWGQLSGVPHAEQAVRQVFGDQGSFPDLASLNDDRAARLFSELGKTVPEAALRTLQRILDPASPDELIRFDRGRQQIVWMLERLATYRRYFHDAARLLLRLAAVENEDYANNATGTFAGFFNPSVGPTEAYGSERLQLLGRVLRGTDEAEALVAVRGLGKALEFLGSGPIITDTGGATPAQPWRVQTFGEQYEYRQRAFELLGLAVQDTRQSVSSAATALLIERFIVLFRMGLGESTLNLAERLQFTENEQRALWANAKTVLRLFRPDDLLSDEQVDRLGRIMSSIYGDSLHDQFRRNLSSLASDWRHLGDDQSEEPVAVRRRLIGDLAEMAMARPDELRAELNWLASDEALFASGFAAQVAELDSDDAWFHPFVGAAAASGNPALATGYLEGICRRHSPGSTVIERILDEWASTPELAQFVAPATAAIGLNEQRVKRLRSMLDCGNLDPMANHFTALAWSEPSAELSLPELSALLERMLESSRLLASTVWMVARRAYSQSDRPDWRTDPKAVEALLALVVGQGAASSPPRDLLSDEGWSRCAELLLPTCAVAVSEAILSRIRINEGRLHSHSAAADVLVLCLDADPAAVWARLANACSESGGWAAQEVAEWVAESKAIDGIGFDVLRDWVEESQPTERHERAMLVASLTNVQTEATPLMLWLIGEFGPESDVARALMVDRGARAWQGSLAEAEGPRLDALLSWQDDENPALSEFARRFRASLLKQIEVIDSHQDERFL